MDLKSWDYVDPKIASRLVDLEKARRHLGEQHCSLKNDNRLHQSLKTKLLQQNRNIESKIKSMLQKQKMSLLDYYDQQIIVVSKNKEQEKIPTLHINREDQSTVEHSKIMEQLKTSVSSRRNKITVRQEAAVNQFSIREHQRKQPQQSQRSCARQTNLYRSRYVRLWRRLKRQSIIRTKGSNKNTEHRKSIQSQFEDSFKGDSPKLISDVSQYSQLLDEYREREQQNEEYIDLLKKKMETVTDYYEKRQAELQAKLKQYAERLGRIASDHSRLQQLQTENQTLRLERDQLLKMLRKFV